MLAHNVATSETYLRTGCVEFPLGTNLHLFFFYHNDVGWINIVVGPTADGLGLPLDVTLKYVLFLIFPNQQKRMISLDSYTSPMSCYLLVLISCHFFFFFKGNSCTVKKNPRMCCGLPGWNTELHGMPPETVCGRPSSFLHACQSVLFDFLSIYPRCRRCVSLLCLSWIMILIHPEWSDFLTN